jgi:hypothetical protein
MSKRKGDIAPQNQGTIPQTLCIGIEGGQERGIHKNNKAGGIPRFVHIRARYFFDGPPSCRWTEMRILGCVALAFVDSKSILETNNGLGMNLTNPAFRQTENLSNFSEREFFVVIQGHNHAFSF